jgi:hypothetical protein
MSTSVRRRVAAFAAFFVSLASFGFAFLNTTSVASAQPGGVSPGVECASDLWNGKYHKVQIDDDTLTDEVEGEGNIGFSGTSGTVPWTNDDADAVFRVVLKVGQGVGTDQVTDGYWGPGEGDTIDLGTTGLSHVTFCFTAPTTTTSSTTTTTTLPEVPGPSCPPPPSDAIVIPIPDPEALRLISYDWPRSHKLIPGVPTIPAGTYMVSLGSYDPSHYPVPPGDVHSQPREEWLLELWTDTERIGESAATPDLADDEWFAYYPDLGLVELTEDVTRVFVRHNVWSAGSATDPSVSGTPEPAGSTANSIDPACAYLVPQEPPSPTTTTTTTQPAPQPGRIIVVKAFSADAQTIGALPAGVTSPSFGFTPSWGAGFGLKIGESKDSGNLVAGAYSVAESPTEIVDGEWKWQLVPGLSSCSDGSPANAVVLSEGETVTCTFVNTRVQVGGIQVTTTTTAPPTTTTTAAVAPSTLPFTGPTDGSLVPIGIAFAMIGLLLLAASYRKEEGQVI